MQLDDAGHMSHSGFTSGNRKDPQGFGWARNLCHAGHRNDPAFIESLEHRESSLAAFFWNIACGSLPDEVINAYTGRLQEQALPRMAPGTDDFAPDGEYTIRIPSDNPLVPSELRFAAAARAPPSALYTHNYARWVILSVYEHSILTKHRRIHKEVCRHRWMFSWTLARPGGPSEDGNFMIPGYRIKIASSANSCVGWFADQWHGTTLRRVGPDDNDKVTLEVGLGFQISPTLATRWKAFCAANYDADVLEEIFGQLRGEPAETLDEDGEEWAEDEGEEWTEDEGEE